MSNFKQLYNKVNAMTVTSKYGNIVFYEIFRNEVCFDFDICERCMSYHSLSPRTVYQALSNRMTLKQICLEFYDVHKKLNEDIKTEKRISYEQN